MEQEVLSTIGMYIDEKTELYELIRQIQNGANVGFRFEYKADGRMTIRISDYDRASIATISKYEILEQTELAVSTDHNVFAASVLVNYAQEHVNDGFLSVLDDSKQGEFLTRFKQAPQISFDTFLTTEENALERAALEEDRLARLNLFYPVTLRGDKYLARRIFDIVIIDVNNVEDTLDRPQRAWLGTWLGQILAIAPDMSSKQNKVRILLIEKVA